MREVSMVMLPETPDSSTMVVPTMSVTSPEPYTVMTGSEYTLPGLLMIEVDEVRVIGSTFARYQNGLQRKLTAKLR